MKTFEEVVEQNRNKWQIEEQVPFQDYLTRVQEELKTMQFTPTPEQLDFLLHLDRVTLVDSTAGSGKTTTIVAKSILDELIWGVEPYRILFLTFSKKSAEDMKAKRDNILKRKYGMHNSARMSTLHSLCFSFLKTYYKNPGGMHAFSEKRLIQEELVNTDDMLEDFFGEGEDYEDCDHDDYGGAGSGVTVIDVMAKFIDGNKELDYINNLNEMRNIMGCFAYQKEKMLDDSQITKEIAFQELECKPHHYFQLKKDVEEYKEMFEYHDFTDLQQRTLEMLREHRDFFYNDYTFQTVFKPMKLYVDEVQDMTPLQKELINELTNIPVSNNTQTSLVCIGDGDQTIYTWRGSETLEFEHFKETFDPENVKSELKIFSKNHRCGKEILSKAKALIENNTLRNPKNMNSLDRAGEFSISPYISSKEMIKGVCRELKHDYQENGVEAIENVAVVYREHSQVMGLVTSLLREGIPFNMAGFKLPFDHWIFRNLLEMAESLMFDHKEESLDCIYKFTPMNKRVNKEFKEIKIKANDSRGWIEFLEERSKQGIKPVMVTQTIQELKDLKQALLSKKTSARIALSKLYSLYNLHNLGYVLKKLIHVENSELDSIEHFINSIPKDETFVDLKQNMTKWESYAENYRKMQRGVKLMTLHSTKGLEFDRVIIIGLDGDYLPKEKYAVELSKRNRKSYIEEERRLLYVGITRAINDCRIYASITKPSLFLQELDPTLVPQRKKEEEVKVDTKVIKPSEYSWFTDEIMKGELECLLR